MEDLKAAVASTIPTNGSGHPPLDLEPTLTAEQPAEVDQKEKQIADLKAQLKQSEIDLLLERRNAIMGWMTAHNLQMQQTETRLLQLGWHPAMPGPMGR